MERMTLALAYYYIRLGFIKKYFELSSASDVIPFSCDAL